MQNADQSPHDVANAFVRQPNGTHENFVGICWPGRSVWLDVLNEHAQQFWASLFSYEKFKEAKWLLHIWNDMNEPAVLNLPIFPLDLLHIKADGRMFENRSIRNAYGALQQRSTWRGLLDRDDHQLRPFVLTRSFFMGSQKYGTYWTGDNRSLVGDVVGSLRIILSIGLSGHPFGGADVPGFTGALPTDEVYIMFYQLGMYYPFFRAHADITFTDREPWNRTPRVQAVIHDALDRRYNLIHYIYTTFYLEHHVRGQPIMQTMWN